MEEEIDINKLDFKFSVGLLGEGDVGKTSILHYFYTGKFEQNSIPTIGVDYHFKFATCKGKTVKIIVWDTAGMEKFNSLSAAGLTGVQALLLVFSLTPIDQHEVIKYKEAEGEEKLKIQKEYTLKTFKGVSTWLSLFNTFNKQDKKIIFLIGNKCDDTENRIVKLEDAMQFAKDNKLNYFETSAKTGKNIQKVFENLTLKIMEIYSCENRNSISNIILDKKKVKQNKKKKCC